MISPSISIRGIQLHDENPVPHYASNMGIGNARFVWWYKRVARPKNGGRRWKSESSWVPFGNGEFGVNIIAVWRHVNATVRSLTFTSDSTDFILTYHSQWMHIQVNYLAYGTSLTKSGRLLQFRLFTVPYFSVRSTRSRAYCYGRPSWFQMYWGGGHLRGIGDHSGGKAGWGVVVAELGGGDEKKGGTGYCRNIIATRIQGHCRCKLKFALTVGLI